MTRQKRGTCSIGHALHDDILAVALATPALHILSPFGAGARVVVSCLRRTQQCMYDTGYHRNLGPALPYPYLTSIGS